MKTTITTILLLAITFSSKAQYHFSVGSSAPVEKFMVVDSLLKEVAFIKNDTLHVIDSLGTIKALLKNISEQRGSDLDYKKIKYPK